jgi:hypothetical protein
LYEVVLFNLDLGSEPMAIDNIVDFPVYWLPRAVKLRRRLGGNEN